MSAMPSTPSPKKMHAGKPVTPARMAAPLSLARPAITAASSSANPTGMATRICTNSGQTFRPETATIPFHSTFTMPETRQSAAPAIKSAL